MGISNDLKEYNQSFQRPSLYQVTTKIVYPHNTENQTYIKEARRTIRLKIEKQILPESINTILERNSKNGLEVDFIIKKLTDVDILKTTTTIENTKIVEAIHDLASKNITEIFPNKKYSIHRLNTYKSLNQKPIRSAFNKSILVPLFIIGLVFSTVIILFIDSLTASTQHHRSDIL